jgi:hypothetical protein
MLRWGWFILLLTIASAILPRLTNHQFYVLAWVDNWGADAGWAIRGALCLVAAVMIGVGYRKKNAAPPPAAP